MSNFTQIDQEYLSLLSLFFTVGDSIRNLPIDSDSKWLYDAGVLSAKLLDHLGTLHHLSKGTLLTIIGERPLGYIDHSSITVVLRTAFETYLTFYYIYCDDSVTINERRFRQLVWKIGGLCDRQKFSVVRLENIPKVEKEKAQLEKLFSQLTSMDFYSDLDSKGKKAARSGNWKYGKSWADRAEIAGFHKEVFKDIYSYWCSYSHSGSLSTIQIGQAVNIEDQKELTGFSLQIGMVLMSHFILSFSKLFENANIALEKNYELKNLALKWLITWKEDAFLKPFNNDRLSLREE